MIVLQNTNNLMILFISSTFFKLNGRAIFANEISLLAYMKFYNLMVESFFFFFFFKAQISVSPPRQGAIHLHGLLSCQRKIIRSFIKKGKYPLLRMCFHST